MIHYYNNDDWDQPQILIMMNMERDTQTFTLPEGVTWGRILDTQSYFDRGDILDEPDGFFTDNPDFDTATSANITLDNPEIITGSTYDLMGSSIVILEEQ